MKKRYPLTRTYVEKLEIQVAMLQAAFLAQAVAGSLQEADNILHNIDRASDRLTGWTPPVLK